jgi:long-chain acyl-CoA synthetase
VTNLCHNLIEAAAMYPDVVALRMGDDTTTYAELDCASSRFAHLLDTIGVTVGDRIGLMLPNTPAFAIAYYGILRAGAVVVPVNPLKSAREVEFFLTNTGTRTLFAAPEFESTARPGAAAADVQLCLTDISMVSTLRHSDKPPTAVTSRAPGDLAVILHTSGTTGLPKGAELTHANLGINQSVVATTLLNLDVGDVVLGCLPLFHAFGMTCGLNATISSGATLTLMPRFHPHRALDIIESHRVTVLLAVPTMYIALLGSGETNTATTTSLRTSISGGAALPVQVLHAFEERFGCTVLEGYGLSETSPVACFNHPDKPRMPGSIGTPIRGVEMRVVDDKGQSVPDGNSGEIQIRGQNVMRGYWNLPEHSAAAIVDGWFFTGDIGRRDSDGYYYVLDRKKALIIRGGYNVYPREIEEVLHEHPAVAEAVVVGLPHDVLGEEVGAAIVFKPGRHADLSEIQRFIKQRVAAYKYPRRLWVLDELPKGPTGKLLRRAVPIPDREDA